MLPYVSAEDKDWQFYLKEADRSESQEGKWLRMTKKNFDLKDYHKPYQNLYETLLDSARKYPDKTAVIDDEGEYTYRQLLDRVDRLAGVLKHKYHMERQEQIAVIMVNSVHILEVFYAAMKIGCIAVMVNTKFPGREMDKLIKTMDVKLIAGDSRWKDKISQIEARKTVRGILTDENDFDIASYEKPAECVSGKEDTAVIMHTSGTTGMPKGVMVSQGNILEAAYGYQEVQGLDERAVTVLSVPIFHILGLSCVSTYFIYMGATIVLSAFYQVDDVIEKIRKYRATHFHTVPAIHLQIVKSRNPDKDLSSLRVMVCGGAPVSDEQIEAISAQAPNAVLHLAYGMTETAGSGTLSLYHKGPLHAVPNVACTVVDENHEEVAPGMIGEVVFHGPCVARGRWQLPSLPGPDMYSGDAGYMDEEGNVYVVDRIKDIVNRGGEKIFPRQIENIILEYPGIRDVSVYPVSDEKYGEVPMASMILKEGADVDIDKLREYLRHHLASYEIPAEFETVTAFPVTQNGKVRKAELRKIAEEKRKKAV